MCCLHQAVLEAREALELRVGRLTDELLSASECYHSCYPIDTYNPKLMALVYRGLVGLLHFLGYAGSRISELDAACRAKDSRILELEVGLAGAEAAIAAHANQVAALEGAIAKLKAEKRVLVKEIKARRASTLPGEAPLLPVRWWLVVCPLCMCHTRQNVHVRIVFAMFACMCCVNHPCTQAALAEEGGGRSRGESDFSDAPGLATEAKGAGEAPCCRRHTLAACLRHDNCCSCAGERRSVSAARMGGASAAAEYVASYFVWMFDVCLSGVLLFEVRSCVCLWPFCSGVRAASARRPSASPEGLRNLAPRISEGEEGDEKDAFWLQVRPWEHSSRPVSAQKERASSPLPPG